ncbi:hypothetical protein A3H80_02390 [Candidatus Roizmanbacteria bacterium RIFCSPLOWO2_02_FULL_37_19]|uniref:Uncharacterized protein n=1 Tax=Candidatus Roizmanbacteria bacterium RIFCSPHIGHO2_02_FULL_37_24 TaxID=1802037 RepID=A0A1F7H1Y2_9BACT|nr:MAG: hypothetical protein A2862_03010 [Candidatus Roizmanbacteria bacterium RIFCSPHIGHO2_01_FULL_38_41]OGK24712.1 MAG: hypothetical protein A3C24_01150 [Candidatus Roizmanbacteria bacterium RIFCSPHIGHO2_02_FULL_37_24]OGK32888.1 MAG: hypothetical protein A3E10_02895 [Candidatus Roizmanbacteria bacterium RIFCSPHIGHO2_12_FULL_37_23]OGK44103.1 MAG: hypothetical protein A2956_03575 [Candidatus Roizmanbacteria bacterium RIFCSPLOWO2_01_FULL_37_57]OGK54390.1 MAG: hypothetical protein A3H80_02390 [Ca
MDLQTIFYIIGIISMFLWIALFIVVIVMLYRIKQSVESFKSGFTGKVVSLFKEKNVELASALGLTVAHFVIDKLKKSKKSN